MNLRRIPLLLYLLAVVGFGIFGAIHRQSYPDITAQPDYLNQLSVAVLPDEACAMASQDMLERFPHTPIISYKYFSMFYRIHCTRVYINIWV